MYSVLIKVCCTVQCCAEIKSKSTPDSNNSTETYSPTSCCHDDEQTRPAATEPWEQDAQLSHAHTHRHTRLSYTSLSSNFFISLFFPNLSCFLSLFIYSSLSLIPYFSLNTFSILFFPTLCFFSLIFITPLAFFLHLFISFFLLFYTHLFLFVLFLSYSIPPPPPQSFNCSFFHPLLISAFCFLFLSIFILSSCSVLPSLSLNRHKCVHGLFFVFLT